VRVAPRDAARVLEVLRGGLIVSVQAEADSLLRSPETIALLSRVAVANGAVGIRAEGSARLGAVRRAVDVPIIGIVKRTYEGFAPYITPTDREIAEVCASGAEIVAFDATGRERPDGRDVAGVVAAIHERGCLAMADCATEQDVHRAAAAKAEIVATTLCGHTEETRGEWLPPFDLVRICAESGAFAICEGWISLEHDVRRAFDAGAHAVVIGTAITNVDKRVRSFAGATPRVG
jgi:N-acylglucosamine-6-phosphate 2-epimerase